MSAVAATRVVIVGGGPRAAYALERLATLAGSHGVDVPEVDVIAPGTTIGPGEIYAPAQPDWLRLNVSSSVVNAWRVTDAEPRGESFDAWRESRTPGSSADKFPSRSSAGAYLADFGAQQRAKLPGSRIEGKVCSIRRTGERYDLGWADQQGLIHSGQYDQVLLAIGHATHWDGALAVGWPADLPLLEGVYPVTRLVCSPLLRAAPQGATVVVRGAALTAIDAAIAIAHHHPGLRIVLASRTGKVMAPKTESGVLAGMPQIPTIFADGRDRLRAAVASVPHELVRIARTLLNTFGLNTFGRAEESAWDQALSDLLAPHGPADPTKWLAHRLAIARGRADPDPTWALGEVWRNVYPALVERQAVTDHDTYPLGWSGYRQWSAELERLAFGPPIVNAQALFALLSGGVAEVCATSDVSRLARERQAVLTVDAVLAPPGVRQINDPLVAGLLDDRLISVAPRGRGVLIDSSATCLVDRRRTVGLAAVGRMTEDVVIGNDTLTRTMHPQLHGWAEHVLKLRESSVHG